MEFRKVDKYVELINRFILEANEGWEPDWTDHNQRKYHLSYKAKTGVWGVSFSCTIDGLRLFQPMKTDFVGYCVKGEFEEELDFIRENYRK